MERKRVRQLRKEFSLVEKILAEFEPVDRGFGISTREFKARQKKTCEAIAEKGFEVGLVFSDEHYCGDVPYLGGNTNISIEQVAGVIGKRGFHIVAGLEGGYIAEQLAPRAGAQVHKVEILKLADEDYPIKAERLEDVIDAAAGHKVDRIAILTPRQVIPAALVSYLEKLYTRENVVDLQEVYYRIKYEKSDHEMRLIEDASRIADAMMRAMLCVIKPGMLETEVAAWAAFVGRTLGAEGDGFKIMVGSDTANRTLIGKALNRPIKEDAFVHLGVSPQRDGLTSCIRRSIVAHAERKNLTDDQKFWFELVEEGYKVGYEAYCRVARENLPAKIQEQALLDYFASRSELVSKKIGKKIDLASLKPYTGTHNSGYTECQEFFGAITLDSDEPLGDQIVTMLDVALRGFGDSWSEVIIPGFDFLVIENTLGKYGPKVKTLNAIPLFVQELIGVA